MLDFLILILNCSIKIYDRSVDIVLNFHIFLSNSGAMHMLWYNFNKNVYIFIALLITNMSLISKWQYVCCS